MEKIKQKYSKLGIASFIFGMVGLTLFVVLYMNSETLGFVIGMYMIVVLFIELVAIVLGFCGLVQRRAKRFFAILGIGSSLPVSLLIVCLFMFTSIR